MCFPNTWWWQRQLIASITECDLISLSHQLPEPSLSPLTAGYEPKMEGHSEGFLPPGSCGLDLASVACGQGPQLRGPVHGMGMVGDGEGRMKSW